MKLSNIIRLYLEFNNYIEIKKINSRDISIYINAIKYNNYNLY